MTTLNVEFEEYLVIRHALREAVAEARVSARRGERYGNADMEAHYQEHANRLNALVEKIDGQAFGANRHD